MVIRTGPSASEIVANKRPGFKGFVAVGAEKRRINRAPSRKAYRYSVYGQRAIDAGNTDEGGARAKLDALAVIVPSLAAFGADAGFALEWSMAIGFDHHARFVARGNPETHGTVRSVSFDAEAIPGIAVEGKSDRAVLRVDGLFAAVALESDGTVMGVEIEFAAAIRHRHRAVLRMNFDIAVNVVERKGAVVDVKIKSGDFG